MRDMNGKFYRDKSIPRFCFVCCSDVTYIDKKGQEYWRYVDGEWFCKRCHTKYFDNPFWNPIFRKKWNPINNPKLMRFKNRFIHLKFNPRKGVCQVCGSIKGNEYIGAKGSLRKVKTCLHHFVYHEDDPLKDTIELCWRCHWEIHRQNRV